MLEYIVNWDSGTRGIVALLIAFFGTLAIGNKFILKLISMKLGQPVRSKEEVRDLFETHGKKAGTPTMGGVMIIVMMMIAVLLTADVMNGFIHVCIIVLLGLGALGFKDDFAKISQGNSKGVSSKFKLIWQFGVALLVACLVYFQYDIYGMPESVQASQIPVGSESNGSDSVIKAMMAMFPSGITPLNALDIPFVENPVHLGWLAIPFFIVVIVGASNAVNLTDGLDGLASGCTITSALSYVIIALGGVYGIADPQTAEVGVFLLAMIGAVAGFLWFNAYPARVFMGDTGSLALGGALGVAAICTKQELLLVIIGLVFVVEALSVMVQVFYFKITKKMLGEGKRLFKCAPIHHHFELSGWKETQVIKRFWVIAGLCAIIGVFLSTK